MTILHIGVLAVFLASLGLIKNQKLTHYILLLGSILFCFWVQPLVPIRHFDFWLPASTLTLVLWTWALCGEFDKESVIDFIIILCGILSVGATRFISNGRFLITRTLPPLFYKTGIFCAITAVGTVFLTRIPRKYRKNAFSVLIVLIILILVILKTPLIAQVFSGFLRKIAGQSSENALSDDIRWLGFSYIAFRLLSVLIDCGKGRSFDSSCGEFLIYVCFPPALTAGPIDQADAFRKKLRSLHPDYLSAAERIALGLFRKFILADALARFSLSPVNAAQFTKTFWAWVSLAAYSLQLFFDFAGYSDIAIGLGLLVGIRLPENFRHPYLQQDLSKFWNCWHITLTQWVRSYVFNPLTRKLKKHKFPEVFTLLLPQVCTMGIIGLWHGVRLNFLIWGMWHALGLFLNQIWNKFVPDAKIRTLPDVWKKLYRTIQTVLTFVFVSLGWVWFVLPDFSSAVLFFSRLFS